MATENARKLFFEYDGSRFYMSRDGVEHQYRQHGVPSELELQWLEELTQQKLENVHENGGWGVIHFLQHHRKYEYLEVLLTVEPKGKLCEKCAFLEGFVRYIKEIPVHLTPIDRRHSGYKHIVEASQKLLRRARSKASRDRIQRVMQAALDALEQGRV